MEITLEKIELVKDRTGVSYKEAKAALEAADSSVVDAIINIEEDIDKTGGSAFESKGSAIVDALRDVIAKGNVSKILVKNRNGEVILNVPVNVGIVGAIFAPIPIIVSAVAAFGFKCVIEIVKIDGTVMKVSEKATETMEKAKEKGSNAYSKIKKSEVVGKATNKAEEVFEKTAETVKNKFGKIDQNGFGDFSEDLDIGFDDVDFEDIEKK